MLRRALSWVLLALGYVWMLPLTLTGLLLYVVALVTGCVDKHFDGTRKVSFVGPGIAVRLRGRFARWMATPNKAGRSWYGHTVGPFMFLYTESEGAHIIHENRHVTVQMIFGATMIVLYPLASLYAWVRHGEPYRQNVFERDARRAAGEEV